MKDFKVIIAGSRSFTDYSLLCRKCDHLLSEKVKTSRIIIIQSGARGADSLGKEYAIERGYEVIAFPAKWDDFSEPYVVKKKLVW